MTELKPCPFCGGHARPMTCEVGIQGTMGHNRWVTITCSMCEINNGGKGGFMRPRYDTEDEASAAWNTRTTDPLVQELVGALEFVNEVPLIVDEATLPNGANPDDYPEQVVVNMCVGWWRIIKARKALSRARGE